MRYLLLSPSSYNITELKCTFPAIFFLIVLSSRMQVALLLFIVFGFVISETQFNRKLMFSCCIHV